MRVKERIGADAGESLAEVLVTILVIGVAALGLVLLQVRTGLATADSRQRTQATALANQGLEQLRATTDLQALAEGYQKDLYTAAFTDGTNPAACSSTACTYTNAGTAETLQTVTSAVAPFNSFDGIVPSALQRDYRARAYVTAAALPSTRWVTVTVSYTARSSGEPVSVSARTLFYIPATP
ncbi:type IV pilus modification PilV family protein [Kineococcus arenarius]|uniref:type IV pilus modification PilV family protein n=1 Tax=Kineococcus sp. SYSU DK007 TaxID=3383128 RepID=UPI003D7C7CAE